MSTETGSDISLESRTTGDTLSRASQQNSHQTSKTKPAESLLNASRASRKAMTPEEKKKHREDISAKYFNLMEKYGPKRKFLIEKEHSLEGKEVAMDPVGFVIKFRLSHAYKALEKQEIEAAIPDIKPVRKRKITKFLLPPEDEKNSEFQDVASTRTEKMCNETKTSTGRVEYLKRMQLQAKLKNKTGIWQTLTRAKASLAQQEKEEKTLQEKNVNASKKGASKTSLVNSKNQAILTDKNKKLSKSEEISSKSLKQKSAETEKSRIGHRRQSFRNRERNGYYNRGMNLPGSLANLDAHSAGGADMESVFRAFSDTMYSGSITVDAFTISESRPSSPSKSFLDTSSRPSSGNISVRTRSRVKSAPKPRTSTPGPPLRPTSSPPPGQKLNRSKSKDKENSGKGKNSVRNTSESEDKVKRPKSLTALLKSERDKKKEKEAEAKRMALAPRKIEKYLYRMCNCHQVARKETLSKLFKKKKVAGVIDVFGCPAPTDPRSDVMFCPFCSVLPQKRINTWLDNLEDMD